MMAMICGREGHSGSARRARRAREEAPSGGPQMDFENE